MLQKQSLQPETLSSMAAEVPDHTIRLEALEKKADVLQKDSRSAWLMT